MHERGSLHTLRLIGPDNLNTLYRKGDHIIWGDRLFRDTGAGLYPPDADACIRKEKGNRTTRSNTTRQKTSTALDATRCPKTTEKKKKRSA